MNKIHPQYNTPLNMKCGTSTSKTVKASLRSPQNWTKIYWSTSKTQHWENIWSTTTFSTRSHWKKLIGTHYVKQEKRRHLTTSNGPQNRQLNNFQQAQRFKTEKPGKMPCAQETVVRRWRQLT
eukprot:10451658-Ditylum_brightwellii.AAC.1